MSKNEPILSFISLHFQQNLMIQFCVEALKAHFWTLFALFRENENVHIKLGSVTLESLWIPNFMQNNRKKLMSPFSEI